MPPGRPGAPPGAPRSSPAAPCALDAGRLLHRPRRAARLAGRDAGPRRRAQRPGRHRASARRSSSCSARTSTAGGSARRRRRALAADDASSPPPCAARRRSAIAIGAVVLVLAARRSALKTGPPEPEPARPRTTRPAQDSELISRSVGARLRSALRGRRQRRPTAPITEPDRLAALSRWQRPDRRTSRRAERDRPGAGRATPWRRCAEPATACSPPTRKRAARQPRPARSQPGPSGRRRRPRCAAGISQATQRRRPAGRGLRQGRGGRARARPRASAGPPPAAGSRRRARHVRRRHRELCRAPRTAPRIGGLKIKFGIHDLVPNLNATRCRARASCAGRLTEESRDRGAAACRHRAGRRRTAESRPCSSSKG